ncbi:uncharacterized protein A1O5_05201 [Cladophialophora psammophila CBS 110553]|uniref:Uncharacterized protein n=1 Tax=Cladophialophora psammophila CBS 110553 TaxID=1182543 RepID=W9XM31_9EURO|nr:uncharacterized protein A1O5_05201 [Cladophialophora psammophila CBS 110553]EXJ71394.1 hypothetical protein A1O5_05201 [Cladophialophora psammophila CBS 110553]
MSVTSRTWKPPSHGAWKSLGESTFSSPGRRATFSHPSHNSRPTLSNRSWTLISSNATMSLS